MKEEILEDSELEIKEELADPENLKDSEEIVNTEKSEFSEPSKEEVQNILDDIKIDMSIDESSPEVIETPKKEKEIVKPSKNIKSVKTPDDQITDDLFEEFNSFLETKAKISSDTGIKQTIPTGIDVLDTILGGGFVIGAFNIIVGQPGSGKSMLAMQTMGNAQKIYLGKILTSFLDSEEATTTLRLANLGVRNPKIKPYSDMTVEKVFKFIEGLCLFKESKKIIDQPSMVIWDSIANTLSQKEREVEDVNSVIGYKARLLSILIPKYAAKMSPYNICLIAINQLRDEMSIGPYGPPKELRFMSTGKTMPGGNVLRYNAFHLLEMKTGSAIDPEKYGFSGVIVKAKCVKNKLFPPNIEIELVGDFIRGFSNFWTNWHFLMKHGRVKSAGGWVYLHQNPSVKFRSKEAPSRYETEPEFKQMFDEAVKEALQTELIDKYNPVL